MSPPPLSGLWAANLWCLLAMLVWSAGLPAAELVIAPFGALTLSALRLLAAAVVLVAVWLLAEGAAALRAVPWGRATLIGGIGLGLASYLVILGQEWSDPVTVAIISASMPVVGIGLEWLSDRRRLHGLTLLGLALSLLGGLVAFNFGIGKLGLGLGALAAFGSTVAFVWGSRAAVRELPLLTPLGRTAATVAGAAAVSVMLALGSLALGATPPDWPQIGAREWSAVLFYGVISLALSQLLWIISVGRLGIGIASFHTNATPFYVMAMLYAMGGSWNWTEAMGAGIVGLGVLVAQSGSANHRTA